MCGFVGKLTLRGAHETPEQFAYALQQLDHRGPDDRDIVHLARDDFQLSLGHTRLSVLDPTPAGRQPLTSPTTGSVVVYNGEVYNYVALGRELAEQGHRIDSRCDTEVVLAAFDRWREHCVERFGGMFALAIWDAPRSQLVLARDRLGIKPLYYYWDGRQLAFASEVTALAALPSLELEVSQDAVRQVLTHGHVPHPLSIYRRVHKLAPGSLLLFDPANGQPQTRRYWDALDHYARPRAFASETELLDALEQELHRAVAQRLVSDVPLGAFLSGGIDSSLVVSVMRRVHSGPVRTFTIGFTEPAWDEAPAARRIARHLQTDHEEFYLSEDNILEFAQSAGRYYDEPFADPSNIPSLALSRLTRERVTVALSGDGGDELFWGYPSFSGRAVRLFDLVDALPASLRRGLSRAIKCLRGTRWEIWGDQLDYDDFASYFLRSSRWQPWLYPDLHRHPSSGDRHAEIGREAMRRLPEADRCTLTGAMYLRGLLVDDFLTKLDRASMSVGLEARVPLLDHRVVELAAGIPARFKTAGGEQKHLLKALLGRYLPRRLWDRPKQGFAVPLVHWFRSSLREWAYDLLVDNDGRLHDWLDRATLQRVLDDHCSGRRSSPFLIWACVQLAAWDRRVLALQRAIPGVSPGDLEQGQASGALR